MFTVKRSGRQVKPNVKYASEDSKSSEGPKKKCERSGCPAVHPICFAGASERCSGANWTSRWGHITLGEHYCNECFEYYYRSTKGGYEVYEKWKRHWSSKARTEAAVANFMVDQIMPYWVQCQAEGCGKWRQLSRDSDLTPEFIDSFQCGMTTTQNSTSKKMKQSACSVPEDERVHYVHSPLWLIQNRCTSFLKKSPAAPFLINYYADGVGLSPTEEVAEFTKEQKKNLCPYVVPFPKGEHHMHALAVTPDMMMEAEIDAFPLMAQECPYNYLAIRNLILAIWAFNPKEWVTKEKCMRQIICRGLTRVSCIEFLPQILAFLTYHNFINQGLVTPPASVLSYLNIPGSVIVVGAGISGLAAAYLLKSHGCKVTVVESKSRLGGRIHDVEMNGSHVITSGNVMNGSHIITSGNVMNGCINNPIAIMAYQLGIELKEQSDNCQLITATGQCLDEKLDRRIEFHYNAILDIVSEWRKNKAPSSDIPLIHKFKELHGEFVNETQGFFTELAPNKAPSYHYFQRFWSELKLLHQNYSTLFTQGVFSQVEEAVMEFHHSSLEFACGACLEQVSALHWDQNEALPQFGGPHVLFPNGFSPIVNKLSQGLDVRLNSQVTEIDYSGSDVLVKTNNESLSADKVIVTLPLAVLKKEAVNFKPALPEPKLSAIRSLGAGTVEKVVLHFDVNFWSQQVQGQAVFGHLPCEGSPRGHFSVFYSHVCSKTGQHVLSSYLFSQGLTLLGDNSDDKIVQACLQVLTVMFPDQDIPTPLWSHVTHWGRDPDIGMAYSYIPVGCDGEAYDLLAETVEEKLYFAGEATNRHFPQTVSGAHLSGIREARKILDSFT
ncbi:lysine-specific histone demethylase 1B-like [Physella acuta]|uniref:lysine-specific histone demethylase 1B-like n=1 Tax=Physella acuta TaxID=109671 RepID=UPI0027DC1827|nr:lysine-specific histone demethylase 1B-like [Physella acuta]